jgi:ribosomal protein S18 acetylase RimI-like enzyme
MSAASLHSGDLRVELRPVRESDREFLLAVYASTREEEVRPLPWNEEQKAAFIAMQFEAQRTHWGEVYPEASRDVVVVNGEPAGRLYVNRGEKEIRIVDIAILPPFRGKGAGEGLLRSLFDEGDASGRPVTIHVERHNPALRLYERLGFTVQEDKGVYLLMKREPEGEGRR